VVVICPQAGKLVERIGPALLCQVRFRPVPRSRWSAS